MNLKTLASNFKLEVYGHKMMEFFKKNPTSTYGHSTKKSYGTFYTPPRKLNYTELKDYFESVFIISNTIISLADDCILEGSNNKALDPMAQRAIINLLTFGIVIVDKNTKDILDPAYCEFHTISLKIPKLTKLIYRDDVINKEYLPEDLAIITMSTFDNFPGLSPLEGLSEELKTLKYRREAITKQAEKGLNTKIYMILDSAGLDVKMQDTERQNIQKSLGTADNADKAFIGFSEDAKGQIIVAKNEFVAKEDLDFYNYLQTCVCTALGVPGDFQNNTQKGSSLSDSRVKIINILYKKTIIALQRKIEYLFILLDIDYILNTPTIYEEQQTHILKANQ